MTPPAPRFPYASCGGIVIRRRPPTISDYEFEDFVIEGYQSHAAIRATVAV